MNRQRIGWLVAGLVLGLLGGSALRLLPAQAGAGRALCPPDAVRAGAVCIDLYEASLWQTSDAGLVARIRAGTATVADLTARATQLNGDQLAAAGCALNGNGCRDVYAVSVAGVTPAGAMTWFQAVAAARNADKRLPTNAEWQAAALGTPDGPPCQVAGPDPGPTGTPGCVSDAGVFDMVGNLQEYVADWTVSGQCQPSGPFTSDDLFCYGSLVGFDLNNGAVTVRRGGYAGIGAQAGVFALDARVDVSEEAPSLGFRGVR
jgi:hypothetical protein